MNSSEFAGFTCDRNEAVNTNCPTQLEKLEHYLLSAWQKLDQDFCSYPARNALKGKFVRSMQYTNWIIPESIINTRYESTSLRRAGVCFWYAFHSIRSALEGAEDVSWDACFGVDVAAGFGGICQAGTVRSRSKIPWDSTQNFAVAPFTRHTTRKRVGQHILYVYISPCLLLARCRREKTNWALVWLSSG